MGAHRVGRWAVIQLVLCGALSSEAGYVNERRPRLSRPVVQRRRQRDAAAVSKSVVHAWLSTGQLRR